MIAQIKSEKDIRDGLKREGMLIVNHQHIYKLYDVFSSFNIEMFKYCNSVMTIIDVNFYDDKQEMGYLGQGWLGNRDWFVTIEDKIELIE